MVRPSHIFDMRSRPGFSGSPVFTYRTPSGDLRSATERGRDKVWRKNATRQNNRQGIRSPFGSNEFDYVEAMETEENTFLMLLGIHAGQYPESVTVKKITRRVRSESDGGIRDGDELKIPSSMTVVVPAWEIENLLLKNSVLVEQRTARDLAMSGQQENIPGAESNDPASEAGYPDRTTSMAS
jgi:hypothetical protein